MGLFGSARGGDYAPRIEKIEVSDDRLKLRVAAFVLMLLIGVGALVWAVSGLLATEPGWTEIEADNSGEPSCSRDFTLYYNLGADGSSPSGQKKSLTALYTQAAIEAEKLFSAAVTDDAVHGLSALNGNVNQSVTPDKAAYDALSRLAEYGCREIFLAPIYEQYNTLFFCATDEDASDLDPIVNEEQMEIIREMLRFVSDPEHIEIVLEDNGRATLRVSQEYLDFAGKNGITVFVDLNWMKNAFAADYIADRLAGEGFADGYITCGEGFTRSLGGKEVSIGFTAYDRVGKTVYKAASLNFGGARSIVVFHDFPLSRQNDSYYYQYADGRMVTPYISLSDGLSKAAVSNLTVASATQDCVGTMLEFRGLYMSDSLDETALAGRSGSEYMYAFCSDFTVVCGPGDVTVADLLDDGAVKYTVRVTEK